MYEVSNWLLLCLFLYFFINFLLSAIALAFYLKDPETFRYNLKKRASSDISKMAIDNDTYFSQMVQKVMFRATIFPVFAYLAFYYIKF